MSKLLNIIIYYNYFKQFIILIHYFYCNFTEYYAIETSVVSAKVIGW